MAIYCRYVPIDDLVNIYEELYGQPGLATAEVIENCTRFLFLERLTFHNWTIMHLEQSPIKHTNYYVRYG